MTLSKTAADVTKEKNAVEAKTNSPIKDITGYVLGGGKLSRALFSKLLGLHERQPLSLYKIKALAWVNDHVECTIETEKGEEIIFLFEKLKGEEKCCFLNTKYLTLRSRGKEMPRALAELLAGKFSTKWFHLSLENLAALLLKDPELGKPGLPVPPHADKFRTAKNFLDTWGEENVYADFIARGEFERSQLDSIDFFNHCTNIQHSDLECNTVITTCGKSMHLVEFPWLDRIKPGGDKNEGGEEETERMSTTDLGETDVIMGGHNKVKKVLDFVLSKNPKRMIFFSNTCVPIVSGEDVESVVKHYQKISPTPLMYLTCTAQSMNNVFKSLLVERRLKAEEAVQNPDPKKINLIGFLQEPSFAELIHVLEEMGVEVNKQLLPTLLFHDIDALPHASLNVFYPNNLWQHLYNQLLLHTRMKYIFPGGPFGFAGTKKWFQGILSALSLSANFLPAWERYESGLKEQWERLIQEAQNYRIGIVTRSSELHYLLDPAQLWGVPLTGALEEMGFGLDIMIQEDAEKKDNGSAFSYIEPRLRFPARHRFYSFNSFQSMRDVLLKSEAHAVFSNHFFDWRLTEAGKNRFSLWHFEKGLTGAVNTLNMLLKICKTPFYKTYSNYLTRTPSGLRTF